LEGLRNGWNQKERLQNGSKLRAQEMKGKSGYGMKKRDTKVAGGPSFLIQPVEEDPYLTPEERRQEFKKFDEGLRNTPTGRKLMKRIQKLKMQLPEV
jgi:hypothetical protein